MEHSPRQHQHQCNEEREASFKNIKHFVAELQDSETPTYHSKIDETKLSLGAKQHMVILFNAFI